MLSATNFEHNNESFSWGRFLMMGFMSLILCISMLMSIFTPLPIAFASVNYGRKYGYALGIICSLIALFVFQATGLVYIMSFVVAVIITEITLRNQNPVKGFLLSGSLIVLVTLFISMAFNASYEGGIKQYLVTEFTSKAKLLDIQKEKLKEVGSSEALEALNTLNDPEKLASAVLREIPGYTFISIFFMIWANLVVLLKSRRVMGGSDQFLYSEDSVLFFKAPFPLVWALIPSLFMMVMGESLFPNAEFIGSTLSKCFGVFFFFHGFGILIKFLNYVRIFGFFRTILVIFSVLTFSWGIALIGLADQWVDFARFFKKRES